MSQKQIQSLSILSMSTQDLVAELSRAAEDNPALIVEDKIAKRRIPKDNTRISSSSTQGEMASEAHQAALEAKADTRTSLSEHFLSQLNMTKIPPAEYELCEKLIYNLDSKGYHFLAPVSLLDKKNKSQTMGLLEKCMERIQQFDPPGLCVKNMEESLYVQARQKDNPPELALFILDGKLSYLDPPKTDRIMAKVKKHLDEQKKMIGLTEASRRHTDFILTEESVDEALSFIRRLDPFPARDFSSIETHYVAADIFVDRIDSEQQEISEGTIIGDQDITLNVRMSTDAIPAVTLNQEEFKLLESKDLDEKKRKELAEKMRKAKELMEAISYRQNTIKRACCEIVRAQLDFFK
ncbi:MAG: hypothetical protein KBS64_05895, partial [Treponema sp.]|nr:hypothetical protein [Candidatus Treponema equi]